MGESLPHFGGITPIEEEKTPTKAETKTTELKRWSTVLKVGCKAGELSLDVMSSYGFMIGDEVILDENQDNEERCIVTGFGSLRLASRLLRDHVEGTPSGGYPHAGSTHEIQFIAKV